MDRRELLKMIAVLTGGAVVGADAFLTGCKNPETKAGSALAFSEEDVPYLDEIAETILPATNTPGAKAAKVGQFMTVIVNDCYDPDDQKSFHDGMKKLDDDFNKKYGTSFVKGTSQQRHDFLVALDKEAKDYQQKRAQSQGQNKDQKTPNHYFALMKQLALWGFFTSKEGMTQVLRYNPVPGKYQGCLDYKKGEKSYAGLGG
ncbi:MAG TPA: gluconate 2-dehydrogenase subunit 3 family protein [Chitinophagaceae bacterium]